MSFEATPRSARAPAAAQIPQPGSDKAGTFRFDVIVVGSGPSGAAAALELAQSGRSVAIIEKASLPRYKTCGGGVLRRAADLLPLDIQNVIERECFAAEMVHHGPALRFLCERERPIVSMVMRDRFDHQLTLAAERAGARLITGLAVTQVSTGQGEVRLTTTAGDYVAPFVVAADGANSLIARKTGRPELGDVVPALECEVRLNSAAMAPLMKTARFDFGVVPAGYAWVFPKKDHLSIGVLTVRRGAANLPAYYQRYLNVLGLSKPDHEERHGYIIPCKPRARMFDVPGVLFVGDAAGLADPITAEGISAGILSGQLAARAIIEGKGVDREVRKIYERTLGRRLLRDLRLARVLAHMLYHYPRLRAGVLSRYGQEAGELLTRIVTGETTYSSAFGRPRNYLRLLTRGLGSRGNT